MSVQLNALMLMCKYMKLILFGQWGFRIMNSKEYVNNLWHLTEEFLYTPLNSRKIYMRNNNPTLQIFGFHFFAR